jgi:membrane glycosyltransferase
VLLAGLAGSAPWAGLSAAHAVLGLLLRPASPIAAGTMPAERTAIAVTVRDEDMARVLPPLRALLDGLDAAGCGGRFGLAILSDSTAAQAAAEAAAVARFRAADAAPARIFYRRREAPTGFKAGNLMDFLDCHAEGFAFAVVLDADSAMSAASVLRLVATMEAESRLAIVQHLTVGAPARAAFPRIFQFGMRAGMRAWARAQGWWQSDAGPFWGHNAILRIAPFRAHARLAPLPDGSAILSHDQIEAAQLQAAGWGVRLLATEGGSFEENPPTLPDFCARDLRWMAGNLQYRHLLFRPGLRAMGRCQLAQAMLMFAGAPFQLLAILAASWGTLLGDGTALPAGPVAGATLAWAAMVNAPRLVGYLGALADRAHYGGVVRLAAGIMIEIVFALLLDGVTGLSRTLALGAFLRGRAAAWPRQNRADRGVTWREAAARFWPHTLLGIALTLSFGTAPLALLWAAPLIAGMVLAIPFAVVTAHPALSRGFHRLGLCAVPEEMPSRAALPDPQAAPAAASA